MKTKFLYDKHFVSIFSPGQGKQFVRGCVQSCRLQNPSIFLAIWVGAAQSNKAHCRGVEPISTPTSLLAKLPTIPLAPLNILVVLDVSLQERAEGKLFKPIEARNLWSDQGNEQEDGWKQTG